MSGDVAGNGVGRGLLPGGLRSEQDRLGGPVGGGHGLGGPVGEVQPAVLQPVLAAQAVVGDVAVVPVQDAADQALAAAGPDDAALLPALPGGAGAQAGVGQDRRRSARRAAPPGGR